MVPGLVCPACGRQYEPGPDEPWRCACGAPLEIDATPAVPEMPPAFDRDQGLWAFHSLLPVDREVSLGEGFTPLVEAPEWNADFKLEYVSPSGSFKDRGATTTLSRAAALGVERIVEDSSGNAGAAIALYAARAGIDAEIYVPEGVKPAKRAAIAGTGATVVEVPGDRAAVSEAARSAVESGAGWYASHAWNPAFFAGTATTAFEIVAQRGGSAPDAVVAPIGHGTLFLGLFRGFEAMDAAGWIDQRPRLLGVQAAGVAPIANDGSGARNDFADGIQIAEPARNAEIERAIETTDGDAIAVGEAETRAAWKALHRAGFHVEPTSAVAVAGLETYRERDLDSTAEVVVPLTGSGLKTDPSA
ncbi:pyridoxal-phosphate dependent enzyme [Halodesulfurarchaeum formicicum]|uniref:pyridoxal-phosphate dependent enzyme n=1 Tax=Halodesulfurarchaeum formicicum TaxID=1873524 RepID=UPI000878BB4F|nr:pyridoxal-phosphate dependent enzyme [Halodesulfurarchaeum formicicum]